MSDREYSIRFEDHLDYLHVFVEGDRDSVEISVSYWTEAVNECRRLGRTKLLIEESLGDNGTAADHYEFATKVATIIGDSLTVAFVDRLPEHDQLNRFGELVASNRGSCAKVFETAEKAAAWLLAN